MFIDSHAHVYQEYYDDIDEVIKRANDNGIKLIINAGCNQKSNEEILASLTNPNLYGVIGIHPENVHEYTQEDLDYVEAKLSNPKILGIGEIGLDYHYEKESKDEQLKLFEYQLYLVRNTFVPSNHLLEKL